MSIEYMIVYLLFLHFIGDFVLQSRWMANNKSRDTWALQSHVLCYMFTLGFGLLFLVAAKLIDGPMMVAYIGLNAALHYVVDFLTSRVTTKLWSQGSRHSFFSVLGFDQFVHMACLVLTTGMLVH